MDMQNYGHKFQARIIKIIEDHDARLKNNKYWVKVLLSININTHKELIMYNQLLGYLAKSSENETFWKFKQIVSHQVPFLLSHADYNGSSCNRMIEW
jgi:hypothetical protein